jgi:hypothetical protein
MIRDNRKYRIIVIGWSFELMVERILNDDHMMSTSLLIIRMQCMVRLTWR